MASGTRLHQGAVDPRGSSRTTCGCGRSTRRRPGASAVDWKAAAGLEAQEVEAGDVGHDGAMTGGDAGLEKRQNGRIRSGRSLTDPAAGHRFSVATRRTGARGGIHGGHFSSLCKNIERGREEERREGEEGERQQGDVGRRSGGDRCWWLRRTPVESMGMSGRGGSGAPLPIERRLQEAREQSRRGREVEGAARTRARCGIRAAALRLVRLGNGADGGWVDREDPDGDAVGGG